MTGSRKSAQVHGVGQISQTTPTTICFSFWRFRSTNTLRLGARFGRLGPWLRGIVLVMEFSLGRWCAYISIVPALAVLAAAPQGAKPAESKPFVEGTSDELTRAVPELAGMQFDFNQDRLDGLLAATGEDLAGMFAKLVDIAATEQIHEMRFEDGMDESSRRETDRYLVKLLPKGSPEPFNELRVDPGTGAPAPAPTAGLLVISHFEKLLSYLLPQYREESRFRYLGRTQGAGQDSWVVAFAQHAGSTRLYGHIGLGNGRSALLQGLVWIDVATHRIVRLRTDLLGRGDGLPFETLTTDIAFVPVKFESTGNVLWLPARVTVHARDAGGELHSVHRYSDYFDDNKDAGAPAVPVSGADDSWEMLDRAISLARDGKPAEAIALMREALRLNPEMPAARYHLAAALRDTGDFAGAEAELREALRRSPNLGPAHNFLGILLFKRGDAAGAAAELRASVQLQPQDATVHFNLAKVLEKSDPKAALEEYRMASTLAPDDAAIKARYEQFERAPNAPAAPESTGTTIKVEVRQVLVPVVVTDKQMHHVTGLTQADFRVFEDGVEQKISGFSVENIGAGSPAPVLAAGGPASSGEGLPSPAPPPKPAAVRRTYLICIDSLHTEFANLVHVRTALAKLFASEQAGDAQYVVLTVGTGTQLVEGPTTDPAAVLKAIESKEFQKMYVASRKGSLGADLKDFLRLLNEARQACDAGDVGRCILLVKTARAQARQIAGQERIYNVAFLQLFRNVVEDLARGTGRRTIMLVSDGFGMVPGKQASDLLEAYFGRSEESLGAVDRMTELDPVLRLAANHNIPIYTVDSRGLYTDSFYDASNPGSAGKMGPTLIGVMSRSESEAGDTLREIAAATGGTAFQNNNDIFAGLERAFADGRQYYVLAYAPANANSDGKFRAISVRVRDGKLSVNAKRGYWAEEKP
jgi:VWFA-related protein